MADLVRRWVRGPLDSPQRPVSLRTRVSSFPQLSPLGLLLQVNLALKFPLIALPFHKEALIARVIFSFPPNRRLLLCKVTASNASPSSLPLVPCQWGKEHTPGAGTHLGRGGTSRFGHSKEYDDDVKIYPGVLLNVYFLS